MGTGTIFRKPCYSRLVLRWAVPLLVTVLSYGLAAGIWKHAALTAGQFCVLFVAVKVATNLGAWALFSRRSIFDGEARAFLKWCFWGHILNGIAWICYFTALSTGPAAIVQTVTAGYTALAALLALLILKERATKAQLAGIALVVAAAMIFGYSPDGGGAGSDRTWFAASLLTILFWGAAMVFFKHAYNQPGADDWRFFVINLIGMAVTVLPYGMTQLEGAVWSTDAIALGALIVLLYAVGDLTLFAALARGPAAIVSPLSGLYPIPTIAYAALVLNETITALQWIAIAMVLVAIVMIARKEQAP
jgi:drug/metabolite transporter (DMT)-like permease